MKSALCPFMIMIHHLELIVLMLLQVYVHVHSQNPNNLFYKGNL